MKSVILAALGVAMFSGAAHAVPLLSVKVFDGASLVGSASNVSGGVLNLTGSDSNFASFNVSVLGIPLIPSPDLSSTTLDVKSKGGAATLTIWITQTDASVLYPTRLASTFTFNALTGTNSSAVLTNYIDSSNTAFGTATQIATASLDPIVIAAGPLMSNLVSGVFSETEKYVITFGGNVQSVSLTSQIIDAPEPISAAMLGAGLLGLGIVRRAKRAG